MTTPTAATATAAATPTTIIFIFFCFFFASTAASACLRSLSFRSSSSRASHSVFRASISSSSSFVRSIWQLQQLSSLSWLITPQVQNHKSFSCFSRYLLFFPYFILYCLTSSPFAIFFSIGSGFSNGSQISFPVHTVLTSNTASVTLTE